MYNDITETSDDQDNEIVVEKWSFGDDFMESIDEIKREDMSLVSDKDIIPDGKTAKQFADLALMSSYDPLSKVYKDVSVYYDKKYELWEVLYLEEPGAAGDCVSVALSKKTGEVLLIWAGE